MKPSINNMLSSLSDTLAHRLTHIDEMMRSGPSSTLISKYLDIANRLEEVRLLTESLLSNSQPPMPPPEMVPRPIKSVEQATLVASILGGDPGVCANTQQLRATAFDDFSRGFGVDPGDMDYPPAKKRKRSLCPHGKRRSECKDCVGACEHGNLTRRCKACKLASEQAKAEDDAEAGAKAETGAKAEADPKADPEADFGTDQSPPAPQTPRKELGNLIDRLSRKCENNTASGLARALDSLKNAQNAQNID